MQQLDLFDEPPVVEPDPVPGLPVKVAVAFGGGKNSVALLLRLERVGKLPDMVVFADTRHESPATYAVVRHASAWCRQRGVEFYWVHSDRFDRLEGRWAAGEAEPMASTLALNGGTEAGMLDVYHANKNGGTPSVQSHSCSVEYKRDVIWKLLRDLGAGTAFRVVQYLGFATEERHRMDRAEQPAMKAKRPWWLDQDYPLIRWWQMDRAACTAYIQEHGTDWPPVVKSGCDECPFQGVRKMMALAREKPLVFDRAVETEERMLAARGVDYPWGWFRSRKPGTRNVIQGPRLLELADAARGQSTLLGFDPEAFDVELDCEASACLT